MGAQGIAEGHQHLLRASLGSRENAWHEGPSYCTHTFPPSPFHSPPTQPLYLHVDFFSWPLGSLLFPPELFAFSPCLLSAELLEGGSVLPEGPQCFFQRPHPELSPSPCLQTGFLPSEMGIASPSTLSPTGVKGGSQYFSYPNNPRRRGAESSIGTLLSPHCFALGG